MTHPNGALKPPADRVVWLDYLRVAAAFAVMIIHISAQNWYAMPPDTVHWQIFNFYDSAVRWAVPVFVMISGAVFLGRDHRIKTIFAKYVLRMFTAFAVWTCVYTAILSGWSWESLLATLRGYYHMWFIPMIAGLYLCLPIFRRIVTDEKVTRYFLALALVFAYLLPQCKQLAVDFGGAALGEIALALYSNLTNAQLHLVLGYGFYFLAGYWLSRHTLKKPARRGLYLLGLLGFVITLGLSAAVSLKNQAPMEQYYGYLTLNVLAMSLAIFVWFRHNAPDLPRLNGIVARLSKYSFGAFLVHALILEELRLHGLHTLSFHAALTVPAIALLVFLLSFAISAVIHQIPVLKRYIV